MTELHWLGAHEIARGYAVRDFSPVDLVSALLRRIEAIDPAINAFIRTDAQGALAAAREAEREILAGHTRGPLHGVPFAVKDVIDVAGHATTCHSKILLDNVARRDAEVVTRLRGLGAIPLGKLACHEFAVGGPAFDLPFPPARNPWNRDHHPGGSSSGSGAALAAGLVPLALGTDSGGSVRHPASACGVVGLKQTPGLVSRRGIYPSSSVDEVGPMARSVSDIALLMDALAAPDPAASNVVYAPARGYGEQLERGVAGMRVGFVRHFHETDIPADAETASALTEVARTLEGAGAEICDVTLPPLRDFDSVCLMISQPELASGHLAWMRTRPGDYCALSRRALMAGMMLPGTSYVLARQLRPLFRAAVDAAFSDVHVLLTASSMHPPCRIDDPDAIARTYGLQARSAFTLTGHPAIAFMAGLSRAGLPLSAQIVGPWHGEATVLRVARAYERATPWHRMRPPITAGAPGR
jgi:aspartyl-tRNA(Asn)/glutamyl-tRNA(Gln) amidotransferase subunit A